METIGGKFSQALVGAWEENKNPYAWLDPRRRRLNKIGELQIKLMNEHLDMGSLRVQSTIAPAKWQHEYDLHAKIAAKILDGDKSTYPELRRKTEQEIIEEKRSRSEK